MKVQDILRQKINEIQNRVPIPLGGTEPVFSFSKVLEQTGVNTGRSGTLRRVQYSNGVAAGIYGYSGKSAIQNEGKASNDKEDLNGSFYSLSDEQLKEYINLCIQKASEKYDVDSNLIKAVIKQESDFNTRALSKAGARGLMQLMPETARMLNIDDVWDIEKNIDGGTRHIKSMIHMFDGDLRLALAAYNAGSGAVRRYGGIPPYEETQNYVSKVMEYYESFSGDSLGSSSGEL